MAEHNLLYILELDGHAKPDDLNTVNFCLNYLLNCICVSFKVLLLSCFYSCFPSLLVSDVSSWVNGSQAHSRSSPPPADR